MRKCLRHFTIVASVILIPTAVFAQRVPAADSGAVIGEVGLAVPSSSLLDAGPALEGAYEYYFTPRASLRMGLGWANPSYSGRQDESLRSMRVALDGVYNWEHGSVHPFAAAGMGIYFLQPKRLGDNAGDSETKVGVTLAGGAEFFTTRTVSVKAEGRYHIVGDAFGIDPGGLALTVGLKKYF
jgi:hypothetical protein